MISAFSKRFIEHGLEHVWDEVKISKSNVIIARIRTNFAGFGIVSYGIDEANINLLGVEKKFQRRGVGRKIVQSIEQEAIYRRIEKMSVQVRSQNTIAQEFYAALGYEVQEYIRNYYRGQEDGLFLHKELIA